MSSANQAKWEAAAETYDRLSYGPERRWAPVKRDFFAAMHGQILFLAAGTGLDFEFFPPGQEIDAIDISPRMLERARPRAAAYDGRIDGVLGEISYYHAIGQSRIVPKLNLEYVVAHTDGFREFDGLDPVTVADAHAERARVMAGAEIGHYWIVGQQVVDVSAYGKFVDNFAQNISAVQVSLGANSVAIQGIRESMYGADAGAGLSWIISRTARLYVNYDGRFRDGFTSHQGTLGLEVKW